MAKIQHGVKPVVARPGPWLCRCWNTEGVLVLAVPLLRVLWWWLAAGVARSVTCVSFVSISVVSKKKKEGLQGERGPQGGGGASRRRGRRGGLEGWGDQGSKGRRGASRTKGSRRGASQTLEPPREAPLPSLKTPSQAPPLASPLPLSLLPSLPLLPLSPSSLKPPRREGGAWTLLLRKWLVIRCRRKLLRNRENIQSESATKGSV